MALDVLEWGVILVMGAGILVYGPEKIPDMAKTLAQAKKQFDGATKQLQGITKELQTGMNSGNLNIDTLSNALLGGAAAGGIPGNPNPAEIAKATTGSPIPSATAPAGPITPSSVVTTAPPGPAKSADQMLIEMARSLRIDTAGKTREEVSKAIMDMVATKPVPTAPVQTQPEAQPETAPPATTEAQDAPATPPAESSSEPSATQ